MSMDSGSDIEMQSALSKKKTKQKMPKSPSEGILKKDQESKKLTTKDMIQDALTVLHTRKGVSLYAVKKFITEKYSVNADKINYLLKKSIKSEVEKGSIIQTKGIGASGSFKLAPKKKPEKTIKKKPVKKTKKETADKPKAKKEMEPKAKKETKKSKPKKEKTDKDTKKKVEAKSSKALNKQERTKSKAPNVNTTKRHQTAAKDKEEKKIAKEKQTPAKKRAAMMKRKSIGSIIKAPKMKPKAR